MKYELCYRLYGGWFPSVSSLGVHDIGDALLAAACFKCATLGCVDVWLVPA